MTVILGSLYQNVPCLLGDVMISSTNPPKRKVDLPVSGQSSSETPIRWGTQYFTDFRQKLNLIGPHLIVAWSGNLFEAQTAIKHLRHGYAGVDPSSFDQLVKLTDSVAELGMKNTTLVCLLANEERWLLRSIGAAKRFQTSWGEEAITAGTGEDHLIDALDTAIEHKHEDGFNQAIGSLIIAASRMWFLDISGVGPSLAFGGAYELAIKQNNRVTKINDILYTNHVYLPDQGIGLVPIFKKIDYYQDYLVVRILDLSDPPKKPSDDADIRRAAVYLIPPADHRWSPSSPPPSLDEVLDNVPDFNASHFATHVKINSTKPSVGPHSVALHEYRTEDKPIKFEYDANRKMPKSIFCEQRYLDEIKDAVAKVLAEADEEF